jgi:predicted O-methyltransferase YrrM
MSLTTLPLTPILHEFLIKHSLREHPLLARLREETSRRPDADCEIAPEQGQFMAIIVEMVQPKRILEVGTYTGYSSLAMALAMPPECHLTTCDIDPKATGIARRYWVEAGLAGRIELVLCPGLEYMAKMQPETIDIIFLDGDKEGYPTYYKRSVELLKPSGVLMVDNMFWDGEVADPGKDDPEIRAIRELWELAHSDERMSNTVLPIADGLLVGKKKKSL